VSYPVENALFQWEEGYRRLREASSDPSIQPSIQRALGRMVIAVEDELRKRLGSRFSVDELASVYAQGTDWALELSLGAAPEELISWDTATVVDAAFYLYMREAVDFAGGSVRSRPA
jgi:hypothetical protein